MPHRSDRFFAWVSGLGVARSDGWIGGVAAGIASRLRIDPLIVRGILVVAALFGLPMILLYAVAWALLPDPEGRIHLRELLRGHFEPAQLGILAGFLLGMLSVTPTVGLFLAERILNPYSYQTYGASPFGVFLFIVGLLLVGILLVLIVRAARRTPGGDASRTASEAQTSPFPSAPVGYSGAAVDAEIREEDASFDPASGAEVASPASSLIPEPSAPPADAGALDAWRAQHAAWQQQDQAWRQQQQDAERAARDQARAERQAAAAAFAAEAAERRRVRRASNPRASFAYVATVIGVALVAAAVVWLLASKPDAVTAALALLSSALVLAFGMVVSGVARRRSGFLALLTVVVLVAGLITGGAASMGDVRFGNTNIWNSDQGSIRQPFGRTDIYLQNVPGEPSRPVVLRKGSGYTEIYVSDGVELRLTATLGDGTVRWQRNELDAAGKLLGDASVDGVFSGSRQADGSTVFRESVSSSLDPRAPDGQAMLTVPVTIDQESGLILVVYSTRPDQETSE
ncbi:PspC domain-containing protein [Microbacterium sp. ARD32]|uniref:PspC domain-containing protein n=1 Tax=Microbacterium sp. ARD32 TaxID=2962577 RepID=UPI0028814AAD|nr:PspC domain-containing protein [Microbacterium sp. ARD32]MDT0158315.1 PspC domain-containing protein [Microbacterium sp. ARD32]